MKNKIFKILMKIETRWPAKAFRAIENGREPPEPKTAQEKLCATDKCGHFSCHVALEMIKLEKLKTHRGDPKVFEKIKKVDLVGTHLEEARRILGINPKAPKAEEGRKFRPFLPLAKKVSQRQRARVRRSTEKFFEEIGG